MKVVLFCGGQGMRLREYSDKIPKPMVPIGYRPILWYVMKYYAHFGHKDFILCLGHQADEIKNYFINYSEFISNDFVFTKGGAKIDLLNKDIDDWKITFVDTGVNSNIGERLLAVQKHLEGEEIFLANYSDGLTDLPLPSMIDEFHKSGKIAMLMSSKPSRSFHVASLDSENNVKELCSLNKLFGVWINAGYFIFKKEIFNYIQPGEELAEEPMQRLIKEKQLAAYPYKGFFHTMDTFKEKQMLDDMHARGEVPWAVWKTADSEKRVA